MESDSPSAGPQTKMLASPGSNQQNETLGLSAQETESSSIDRLHSPEVYVATAGSTTSVGGNQSKPHTNAVSFTMLYGVSIVSLYIDGRERLCLAQISNTLLKRYSYNEIHNRRVALGITCVQCTPVQLEILRRAGAMPISSRRCGMITKREAERLVKSFLEDNAPPKLPDNFAFDIKHSCGWGCRGSFIPSRYNSSRAKCIKCSYCNMYFSPNKFIFHYHRTHDSKYNHPDAANFNSWRRHMFLSDAGASDDLVHAWEDVKAMFNGGSRKRILNNAISSINHASASSNNHLDSKRVKLRSEMVPSSTHSTTPGLFSCPVFPMNPAKVAPPGLKSLPQHPAIFGLPFGAQKPPMVQHPSIKPLEPNVPPFGSIHETMYPPYEMIWAKHLGLANHESGLVTNQPHHLPSRLPGSTLGHKIRAPGSSCQSHQMTDFSAKSLIGDSNSFSMKNSVGKLSDNGHHYTSAFKPVMHGVGASVPHPAFPHPSLMPDTQGGNDSFTESCDNDSENESSMRCGSGSSDDRESECDENIDVDTLDDSLELNNNNNNSRKQDSGIRESEQSDRGHDEAADEQQHLTDNDASSSHVMDRSPVSPADEAPDVTSECDVDTSSPIDRHHEREGSSLASPSPPPSQLTRESIVEAGVHESRDLTLELPAVIHDVIPVTHDVIPASRDGVYRDFSSFSKEQLQEELLIEIQVRKKTEFDCCSIRDTFREQVDREKHYRDEMSRQLQLVKETLRQELEQERKARLALQQKLKEAHNALQGFPLMPSRSSSMTLLPR